MCFAACHSDAPSHSTSPDAPEMAARTCDAMQSFGAATEVQDLPLTGMSLTGDEQTMFYAAGNPSALYIATRTGMAGAFSQGVAINALGAADDPEITPDGLTLYYVAGNELYVTQRASTNDAFAAGSIVPELPANGAAYATLSATHVFLFEPSAGWYSAPLAADGTIASPPTPLPASTDPAPITLATGQIVSPDEREWYSSQVFSNMGGSEVIRWGDEGSGVLVPGSLSTSSNPLWISPGDCDFYYVTTTETSTIYELSRPAL
jgi:hypothetical protein